MLLAVVQKVLLPLMAAAQISLVHGGGKPQTILNWIRILHQSSFSTPAQTETSPSPSPFIAPSLLAQTTVSPSDPFVSPFTPSLSDFASPGNSTLPTLSTRLASYGRGINGGFPCAACSVLLGMSEQLADINNTTLFSALDTMCSYLPNMLGSQCSILVHVFGPEIIESFSYGSTPDQICYQIGVCVDDQGEGQICHLFPIHHLNRAPPGDRGLGGEPQQVADLQQHLQHRAPPGDRGRGGEPQQVDDHQQHVGEAGLQRLGSLSTVRRKIRKQRHRKFKKTSTSQEYDLGSSVLKEPGAKRGKSYKAKLQERTSGSEMLPWVCNIPGVWQLCQALDRAFHRLVPGLDVDGDGHSPVEELRGSLWRGRDCNDGNPSVSPGKRPWAGDIITDTNCNGIQGLNPRTGVSWEEELCGGSGARGLVYIGDSVGGHFHLPPQWFRPQQIDAAMFSNISQVVAAEADWPQLGFATGFRNSKMPGLISGITDSIYLRLREKNLCNHRDYHNLARNGADSFDTLEYLGALARTEKDLPALVFYSLIGNDVCRMSAGNMTTPAQFRQNVLKALDYMEEHLAPGSHVVLVGLIDAGFLYKAMSERYHPIGEYFKNVKYKDVYKWFNCMQIGPCWGWMNGDVRARQKTSKRARQLTSVLRQIAAERRYNKFDLAFLENPFSVVLQEWVAGGGEIYQLVEPVDSLHPTQAAQALIAEQVWSSLENRWPHFLGPDNPKNGEIKRLFGDQGGH